MVAFLGSTSVVAILAARPLGLPVVISERNDPAIQTLDDPWQYLRERCYRWGTVVTANSRGALETMKAFVPASKLAYVPNPVLVRQAGPGAASRDPVILAVGRLVPQKAFDILLRAFAGGAGGLAGWSVEILGDGPLRKELERLAEELGVRHRVVFHGYVDDPAAHYARAGIFALPSRYEGMPNALLEAMAAGLPVIVSDASPGPLEEVADGAHGIVVPAGDVAALTAAMIKLAGDAGMRRAMGEACRTRSAEHGLERTLAVWQEVVDPGRGPAASMIRAETVAASSPLRVCHLITTLDVGGAELMLARLVERMDPARFQCAVISLVEPGPVGARLRDAGVSVTGLGLRRGRPAAGAVIRLDCEAP